MKLNDTTSKLFGFTVGLAVLGLLAVPVVGSQGLKDGGSRVVSIEDETDWTLAGNDGTSEEENDWTLAKNNAEEEEIDRTLASNDGIHEEEVDWTLA